MYGREGYAIHEECYSLCVAYSRPGDPIFNSSIGGRAIALAKQRSPRLTLKTLKNSEYDNGKGTRKFRLRDGAFESGKPGGDYLHAEFEQAAFGDLNGDSVEDAAVIFWWSGGGSGAFVTLAAAQ